MKMKFEKNKYLFWNSYFGTFERFRSL